MVSISTNATGRQSDFYAKFSNDGSSKYMTGRLLKRYVNSQVHFITAECMLLSSSDRFGDRRFSFIVLKLHW